MTRSRSGNVTQILSALARNEAGAVDQLFPVVYAELRRLAAHYLRGERQGHTLQPTALVNEAYVKLVDETLVDWQGRHHFFAVAANAMKRVLVDHARHHNRAKRGGGLVFVTLDPELAPAQQAAIDIEALHEALERLAVLDERQARVVELRYFGGLSVKEVAETLDLSTRTVEAEWTHARAWLKRELDKSAPA